MSFCADCTTTLKHEGTPVGEIKRVGGVETYVSLPAIEHATDKAVLFLTDVFGQNAHNNQLVADAFAANGFQVYMPDLFDGDPVTEDHVASPEFDIGRDWFPRHTTADIRPIIDKLLTSLKESGITSFAATGYCLGARYAVDLAFENAFKVIAISHPSLLDVPADFERLLESSRAPVLVNSCEFDPMFPVESQRVADELLGEGRYEPGYERTYWPGCTHGFAVRGDVSQPLVKAGKEGAFNATVAWFSRHL